MDLDALDAEAAALGVDLDAPVDEEEEAKD